MIVGDLHVVGISAFPAKANPPLVVDPDAVLILAISGELFETVPRGHSEIAQRVSRVEQEELLQGRPVNTLWEPSRAFAIEAVYPKSSGHFLGLLGNAVGWNGSVVAFAVRLQPSFCIVSPEHFNFL